MCVIAWAWRAHPRYPLAVLANRDERHDRRTAPLHWWRQPPGVLAGRDLEAGGTWLGVTRSGRFAAVTNRAGTKLENAPSRGGLPVGFLTGAADAAAQAATVARRADDYAGFSLLFGDGDTLAFVSNREPGRFLEPGIYGMANAALGEDAPKVRRLTALLEQWAGTGAPAAPQPWLDRLADAQPAPGAGPASAVFVRGADYGTRASSVVVVEADGRITFAERSFGALGRSAGATAFEFGIVR